MILTMSANTIPASDRKVSKKDNQPPREVSPEHIHYVASVVSLIATRMKLDAGAVMGKRGATSILGVRKMAMYFLRGRVPVWALSIIFDLDRGQVNDDAREVSDWIDRNAYAETQIDHLCDGLDHLMQMEPEALTDELAAEIEADRTAKRALRDLAKAVDKLERPALRVVGG